MRQRELNVLYLETLLQRMRKPGVSSGDVIALAKLYAAGGAKAGRRKSRTPNTQGKPHKVVPPRTGFWTLRWMTP